ncbi:hypothetical protein PAHAL_9G400200 [Panicum hallii]|jgi:hypothetical protein|uniref:TFIIS N-terminal domain-containing protein n=1 Tax=Panicum hallii TaxID=206008 RepID=A0A2T8I464_9POAL|nr:uncharacterized protein LOC112877109 [Panicum hallii]PVH32456.1 hypothetical protein PAHAL_9G400200 [Panicum hallii]
MAGQSPLRRWKPFFAAFGLVDAAIEAAGPALCRDELRGARGEVVELLCGVPAGGGGEAEELCAVLDGFMAESLLTLQAVPAEAVPRVLASSADLAEAIGALRCHQSARVRGLARDVVRGWSAAVEDDIARASAAMAKLDDLCRVPAAEASRPSPVALSVSHGPRTVTPRAPTAIPQSLPKRTPPPAGRATRDCPEEEKKMDATKRKLREGYRGVEDAKRQRKIQVIQAPKILERRQREMHPILRERSQARCGTSAVARRRLLS